MVDFVDLSENVPTSWQWKMYDPNGDEVPQDEEHEQNPDLYLDTLEGWYDIHLTVENDAGIDEDEKLNYLEVATGGVCEETNVTPIATMAPLPTGIENVINRTVIRNMAGSTFIGNLSGGWFNASDYFADGVNATFSDVLGIFTTPLDWLNLAVGSVFTMITSLTEPFLDTSNFMLQMISRSLASLPAVIVNLVTLSLLVDVVRLVLAGRGGSE